MYGTFFICTKYWLDKVTLTCTCVKMCSALLIIIVSDTTPIMIRHCFILKQCDAKTRQSTNERRKPRRKGMENESEMQRNRIRELHHVDLQAVDIRWQIVRYISHFRSTARTLELQFVTTVRGVPAQTGSHPKHSWRRWFPASNRSSQLRREHHEISSNESRRGIRGRSFCGFIIIPIHKRNKTWSVSTNKRSSCQNVMTLCCRSWWLLPLFALRRQEDIGGISDATFVDTIDISIIVTVILDAVLNIDIFLGGEETRIRISIRQMPCADKEMRKKLLLLSGIFRENSAPVNIAKLDARSDMCYGFKTRLYGDCMLTRMWGFFRFSYKVTNYNLCNAIYQSHERLRLPGMLSQSGDLMTSSYQNGWLDFDFSRMLAHPFGLQTEYYLYHFLLLPKHRFLESWKSKSTSVILLPF